MTPFMVDVRARLAGEPTPLPETEPSRARTVAVATDTQVIVRSLAEQLVSEANAILREHDAEPITLVDHSGPGELAFTLGHGDRSARVQTVMSGHTAVGRLLIAGEPQGEPRQLRTEEELRALVLNLLTPAN